MNVAVRAEADDTDTMPTFVDLSWDAEDRDDTWLITYADVISTALAMVVLLFGRAALAPAAPAAPVPTPAAVAAVAAEPASLFGPAAPSADEAAGAAAIMEPVPMLEGIETAAATAALAANETVVADGATTALEANSTTAYAVATENIGTNETVPPAHAGASNATRLDERLATLVTARFAGRVAAERRNEGVVLTIPAVALFDSARADLSRTALPLLNELTATLREVGEAQISVEGHTDDRRVQRGTFRSNWDLAAARANAVTAYFLAQGFAPQRLHSVSYADTRPVADNASPEGRAANRRVELAIDFETRRR